MRSIIFLLFFIIFSSFVIAYDPSTHYVLAEKTLQSMEDTPYKEVVSRNKDYFIAGSELPDISVIFYFSTFKNYMATHDWDFCGKMLNYCAQNEKIIALSLGCYAHQVIDADSHNLFIPYYIKKYWLLDEASLHPITEESLGKYYLSKDNSLQTRVDNMLNVYDDPDVLNALKCANGGSEIGGWEIKNLMIIHRNALSDFYRKGYGANAESSPIGTRIYIFWRLFQFVNKPMSKYVIKISDEDASGVENRVIPKVQGVLRGSFDTSVDPTGVNKLKEANKTPVIIQGVLSVVSALAAFWFGRKKKLTIVVAGLSAILSVFLMYYMGFLGILVILALLWLVSWPFIIFVVYKKFYLKKKLTGWQKFIFIYNIFINLILLWIWLI